jgi:transmembrane sensor
LPYADGQYRKLAVDRPSSAAKKRMTQFDTRIDQLIVAALRNEANPGDLKELEAWRRASPDHELRYRQTERLWHLVGSTRLEVVHGRPPDASRIVEQAGIRALAVGAESIRRRWWKRRAVLVEAIAAAVVLSVIGLRLAFRAEDRGALAATEFSTGPAETATVSLLDGSIVRLGPESRLQVLGGASTRSVSFHGRAFFAIAHDRQRPFQIQTPAGDVKVLGTRFDLQTGQRDLQLVVLEGRVSLSNRGQETVVQRGQVGRVLAGVAVPAITVPDINAATSWLGDFYAFQSTPLREAAAEIGLRSGWEIQIADAKLVDRTVTGYFTERDLRIMIRVICAAVLADCDIAGRKVVMKAE